MTDGLQMQFPVDVFQLMMEYCNMLQCPIDVKPEQPTAPQESKKKRNHRIPKQDANLHIERDTKQIAGLVKLELKRLEITQETFGRKYLKRCRRTVHGLLNRPKPWDQFPAKGRQCFIKMESWLGEDDENKLKMVQSDKQLPQ